MDDLAIAMRHYELHGCIVFWNPRDITDDNLRTDIPDVEALLIEPGNVSSCEVHEGQYLVKEGQLQPYDPYPGHEGVDAVFEVLKRVLCGFMATSAIKQCVKMRWRIMEATSGEDGLFFKPYNPPREASRKRNELYFPE